MSMQSTRRRNPLAGPAGTALLCAALALPGIAAAAPAAAQGVELRWKLEAGTDLVYRVSVESESELPQGMGTSTMHQDVTHRWSVVGVDGDGNATVRVTTERVRMSMAGPMGTMSVDSADPTGSGSPLDAVTVMAGTSYSVVLDPRGTLVGMSGVEEMREAVRARIPDPSARALLDQMLSEEALRSQWAQGGYELPTEAVAVGSTWESTFVTPLPTIGSLSAATSSVVESMDGDIVVIANSGTISLSDDAVASPPIPMSLGDATMTGTTRFDAGRGRLLGTEGAIALQITMTMGGREAVLDTVTRLTAELVEE